MKYMTKVSYGWLVPKYNWVSGGNTTADAPEVKEGFPHKMLLDIDGVQIPCVGAMGLWLYSGAGEDVHGRDLHRLCITARNFERKQRFDRFLIRPTLGVPSYVRVLIDDLPVAVVRVSWWDRSPFRRYNKAADLPKGYTAFNVIGLWVEEKRLVIANN